LCLSRKVGQRVIIGEGAEQIIITVLSWQGQYVRIGVEAPRSVPIVRSELLDGTEDTKE
jgi:carbon storage regulator